MAIFKDEPQNICQAESQNFLTWTLVYVHKFCLKDNPALKGRDTG